MKSKFNRYAGVIIMISSMLLFSSCSSYKAAKPQDASKEQVAVKEPDKVKVQVVKKNQLIPYSKERDFATMGVPLKYNNQGIPVLMYHSIGYEKGNVLRVPKEKFREEMQYLKDNGYTTLTLDELYDFYTQNKPVPEKSVVITLDDGYEDNYQNAYPVLKEFGLHAVVFVVTAWVDKPGPYMTSAQLKELQANGIEIQSHTVNHDELNTESYDAQLKTLIDSKGFLEKELNKKEEYLAYPFGKYNSNTIKAMKAAGYKMAFTTAGRWSDKTDGLLTLDRVFISADADMNVFKTRITNPNY